MSRVQPGHQSRSVQFSNTMPLRQSKSSRKSMSFSPEQRGQQERAELAYLKMQERWSIKQKRELDRLSSVPLNELILQQLALLESTGRH